MVEHHLLQHQRQHLPLPLNAVQQLAVQMRRGALNSNQAISNALSEQMWQELHPHLQQPTPLTDSRCGPPKVLS